MTSLQFTTDHHDCDSCRRRGPGFYSYHRGTPVLFHCEPCARWTHTDKELRGALEEHKRAAHTRMERARAGSPVQPRPS